MWKVLAEAPIAELNIEDLRLGHTAVMQTLHNIEDGYGAGTNSGPPEVFKCKFGDYQVTDGHHRVVQALLGGQKTIKARILHSDSDYYATSGNENAFKPNSSEPYGGLHRVWDEELLKPLVANSQNWTRGLN